MAAGQPGQIWPRLAEMRARIAARWQGADFVTGKDREVRNAWFETVAEAQRRAKQRLPQSVYGALVAGSEK